MNGSCTSCLITLCIPLILNKFWIVYQLKTDQSKYWKNVKFAVGLRCSLAFSVFLVCSRYLGFLLLPCPLAIPTVLYYGFASTQPLMFVTDFLYYELKMSYNRRGSIKSCKKRLSKFNEEWERHSHSMRPWDFSATELNCAVPENHVAIHWSGSQNWISENGVSSD